MSPVEKMNPLSKKGLKSRNATVVLPGVVLSMYLFVEQERIKIDRTARMIIFDFM